MVSGVRKDRPLYRVLSLRPVEHHLSGFGHAMLLFLRNQLKLVSQNPEKSDGNRKYENFLLLQARRHG